MALKLGELVAYLKADDDQFQKSMKKAQKDWKEHGDKLKDTAKVGALAIGAALGAGVIGAINLEGAKAKFAAQLGGDAQYAADMGRIAGNIYTRGFGESAEEAMGAVRATLSSGLLDEDAADADIERISVKAQALAGVFGQDVTQAARAAGQMIRTGMASNADEAFDILTRGFQQSGDLADDLLDTVNEYSTKFRDLGLNGQMAMGLLTQGIKAGARDIDTVADALKEFSIRAIDGSKATSDGFKAIGLDAQKMAADIAKGGPTAQAALDLTLDKLRAMKNPVDQNTAAVALFGTKAEDLGNSLFALDPSSAVNALGQVAGASDKLGNSLEQSAGAKLESFKRKAQQALVEKMAEAIPTIERVVGFMEKHKAVVDPLITVLGVLAGIIGTIVVATKIWTAVQIALNVAMMLNPVGLIVLAVIALIAIFAVLWVKFEGFRNFWKDAWDLIWGAIKGVWNWISDNWPLLLAIITGPIGLAVLYVTKHWDDIKHGAQVAKDWIVDKFNALVGFVTGLPGRLASAASGMWNGIKDSFRSAINWIIGRWNNLSLTIGGGSIMGVSIPSVRLDTPNIPMLADGGIVRATPGGRLVGVAEGGQDEVVAPLSKLDGMMGGRQITVKFDTGGDPVLDALFAQMRRHVKAYYEGDVDAAFAGV